MQCSIIFTWKELKVQNTSDSVYPERVFFVPIMPVVRYESTPPVLVNTVSQVTHNHSTVRADLQMIPLLIFRLEVKFAYGTVKNLTTIYTQSYHPCQL